MTKPLTINMNIRTEKRGMSCRILTRS